MEKPLCGSVWTKKSKIKDVFEGEKLFEGLEDEILGSLPNYFLG